jgi:26-hydroxylase
MQQIIGDMFSAGSETVKTTLQWATLFAVREPQVQAKVQAELDRVVGRRRLPSLDDLPNLPYTEAVILEVMRRATAVPLGTTHCTSRYVPIRRELKAFLNFGILLRRTTQLNGHTVPKGTQVIPLIHAVHMDPALWKDPEVFNPERFLNAEGQVVKPEYFIPFGVGRRMCLGDALARAELFLFFSSLLHVFSLQVPEGAELPGLRGQAGVTVSPENFKVNKNSSAC